LPTCDNSHEYESTLLDIFGAIIDDHSDFNVLIGDDFNFDISGQITYGIFTYGSYKRFQAVDLIYKLLVGHSRSLVSVPVDRPHNDFLFVHVRQ